MLRAAVIAAALALFAQPVWAQQSGFYGATGPERKFAKEFYEAEQESGIEYVSVSFRLRTLTIYPSEELFKSWNADEGKARLDIFDYATRFLEKLRERWKRGEITTYVKVRYPNSRRAYETFVGELVSAEGTEGEFTLTRK
ncbi:MAG: hypothetical protein R6W82_06245 [bacterium]